MLQSFVIHSHPNLQTNANLHKVIFTEHIRNENSDYTKDLLEFFIRVLGLFRNVNLANKWRKAQFSSHLDCIFTNE